MNTRPFGRVLGLDYGLRRIGVAVSDIRREMVFPRPLLENKSLTYVCAEVSRICREEEVSLIVVGLPLDDTGESAPAQVARVKTFGEAIHLASGVPVTYEDERYTTAEAEAMLLESGVDFSERKKMRDAVAAMIIVQAALKKL